MKINIEFDTKTKQAVITANNQVLENVTDVSVYQAYDEKDRFVLRLTSRDVVDDGDVSVYTHIEASEDKVVKSKKKEKYNKSDGAIEDIKKYLGENGV